MDSLEDSGIPHTECEVNKAIAIWAKCSHEITPDFTQDKNAHILVRAIVDRGFKVIFSPRQVKIKSQDLTISSGTLHQIVLELISIDRNSESSK